MCGIVGAWQAEDASSAVEQMASKLSHRGPDDTGFYYSPDRLSALGHTRLAIMDPVGGAQPMYSEDGRLAMVANGEVYNFRTLREGLSSQVRFFTTSDSEVILRLHETVANWSMTCLDGMFAFLLLDEKGLLAVRDPLGIKPLYYGKKKLATYFASERKALQGRVGEIQELPPGSWYHTAMGVQKYYEVPKVVPNLPDVEEASLQLNMALQDAVKKRLMSDVPLGVFLSGGLDSSIVAAISRTVVHPLHTFAVGMVGSSDLLAARQVAKHLDTIHHEYIFTRQEIFACLPEILYHLESHDQDLVSSAVPCYFASRLAAEYVKVVLSGEGADELFAGYDFCKSVESPYILHLELRQSVRTLHRDNLQRLDRMSMAHSLEARVPFLDVSIVALAQRISLELKLRLENGTEKWILRKAFEHFLPPEIVWRKKETFGKGSGVTEVLSELVRNQMTPLEASVYAHRHFEVDLRSVEECVYHRMLMEVTQ